MPASLMLGFTARVAEGTSPAVARPDGDEIPVRVYRASDDEGLPVVVYFHGGGFVLCGLETHDNVCRSLTKAVGCVTVSAGLRGRLTPTEQDEWTHVVAVVGKRPGALEQAERLAGVEESLMSETEQLLPSGHRAHHQHRHRAYFSRGLYADQLERWLEHFDRKQLLVIGTEDLLARPQETYAEVLGFLGLRDWQLDDFPEHNKKPYSAIDADVRARLEERYAEPNERLERLLGREFSWASQARSSSM